MVFLVLTGEQLKAARSRARMTQEAAADAAGVTLRTWGNWERSETLAAAAEARARDAVGPFLHGPQQSPLSAVSDAQLLAEIAARFDRGRQQDHGTASTQARGSRAAMDATADAYLDELSPEVAAVVRDVDAGTPPASPQRKSRDGNGKVKGRSGSRGA